MNYIPNTDDDRAEMLKNIGVSSVDELFRDIPAEYRYPEFHLPPATLRDGGAARVGGAGGAQRRGERQAMFSRRRARYQHFIPSVVTALLQRSEFTTAYTPYQPEISQGTLQAHFEYQSMIAALTGMEAANVSHYDGATSAAEAVTMALENRPASKRSRVLLSPTLHPQYRAVIHTYLEGLPVSVAGEEAPRG